MSPLTKCQLQSDNQPACLSACRITLENGKLDTLHPDSLSVQVPKSTYPGSSQVICNMVIWVMNVGAIACTNDGACKRDRQDRQDRRWLTLLTYGCSTPFLDSAKSQGAEASYYLSSYAEKCSLIV